MKYTLIFQCTHLQNLVSDLSYSLLGSIQLDVSQTSSIGNWVLNNLQIFVHFFYVLECDAVYKSSSHCCHWSDLRPYLDERSSPGSTQHRHLAGIDAVGTIFTRMVHAQDSVQHLLLLTVAWGRYHTVSTRGLLQGRWYSTATKTHNCCEAMTQNVWVLQATSRLKHCPHKEPDA